MFVSKSFDMNKDDIDDNIKMELKKLYKSCYKYWIELSDEQKDFLMDKIYSSLETRVSSSLDKLNITHTKRFMIGKRFFDIKVKDILIDVNSDLWHANPMIYKENDIIRLPFKNVKAKVIWQRDLSKKLLAESCGYRVYYIWESDIKDLSDDDIMSRLVTNIFL
jgi:G:T-mismatch repair DNA endonuclease (very short patch repair protein)